MSQGLHNCQDSMDARIFRLKGSLMIWVIGFRRLPDAFPGLRGREVYGVEYIRRQP